MSHEYSFRVWGDTREDIERQARIECARYFGAAMFEFSIDADAWMQFDGKVGMVQADVTAWAVA